MSNPASQNEDASRKLLVEFAWAHPLTQLNRLQLLLSRMMRFDPISSFLLEMSSESCYQITSSLVKLWKNDGFVHTSLTELSHSYSGSFILLWHKNTKLGLKYFDTQLRAFTAGIRDTNIGVNYTSPLYVKDSPFKITLWDLEHVETFRPDVQGYSYLSRMIAEIVILSCLPCLAYRSGEHPFPIDPRLGYTYFLDFPIEKIPPIDGRLVGEHVKHGLCCALNDHGVASRPFSTAWEANDWSQVVEDIADALRTDVLRLNRVARIAEQFVLVLESLLPTDNEGKP